MTLLPANFGAPKRGAESVSSDARDGDGRADVRVPVMSSSPMSDSVQATRSMAGVPNLSRLSVTSDGRLLWDDKPVVVRRRLQLSFWQKLGAIIIGLAALIIALSGAIHAAITAHDWMCSAKWVTSYCAAPPPLATPIPPTPPERPELPN